MIARKPIDERGQVSLMIIGLFLVAVLLVVVVVDASAAYLRRQELDSLADGAALAAVDGVQGEAVYTRGLGERAVIDPVAARAYGTAYLRALGAHRRYPGLQVRVETTADSVRVRITTPLDLPLLPPGWDDEARVTGHAAAYVDVGQ
jgi:type II secretory pathway component PulM